MTDQATGRKPLAKERRPSRLRHEIRPESTGDKRNGQADVVQEPHSDAVVFDTQLDTRRHAGEHTQNKDLKPDFAEAPLSPNSQVTLQRFGTTKMTSISGSDPILFKPFAKEPADTSTGSVLPSQSFSYGRLIRTSQMNTKGGTTESRPTIDTTSMLQPKEESDQQKPHDTSGLSYQAHEPNVQKLFPEEPEADTYSEKQEMSQMTLPDPVDTLSPTPVPALSFPPMSTAQPVISQDALHRASSRGAPNRIAKPRQGVRTNQSETHGCHGASISPAVQRSLKNLELAFLAENFRKHDEHTTQLQHAEERTTLLRQQVDLLEESLADCRKQRDGLKMALDRLTEKAKTNQKFLEGFQKDYETLKKLAMAAREDNKKVLNAKMAEVEAERKALIRELETTTCKLAESQRKTRAVAGELYVELVIAYSAKASLTERLNTLQAAYESEKNHREEVEREVPHQIQTLRCQFNDGSNALVKKLEQLQASIEKITPCDRRDKKIKECLEILNSLQTAPLLKIQDVRQAEGMLRFVQARVESGLEGLHKAIMCSVPSNADLHASINEQLRDLRTNMMKYEEVAAESCSTKELNAALTQQLQVEQEKSSHLNEKVEHLRQVEIELRVRSGELERDLSSMKIATHSSRSEKSASEQVNQDLRQRLKGVEDELKTANQRAGDLEKARQALETQAGAFKARYEAAAQELEKVAHEQMAEKHNTTKIREKLSEEHKLRLSEIEREIRSEVERLKVGLQEKEASCQNLSDSLSIANKHLDELRKRTQDEQDANSRMKAEISQQQSAMKALRQEADERATQMQQEAQAILKLTESRVTNLERENQALLSKLEEVRANEGRMKANEKSFSAEQDHLHDELRKIHSEIDKKDAEIMQMRSEYLNEHRKLEEQCRNEIEHYKHRLAETSASLQEAEAKARLSEDQYRAKIAAERTAAESRLLELEKENHGAVQQAKQQTSLIERHNICDVSSNLSISRLNQHFPLTNGRKKVNRDNESVIEATQEQNHSFELPIFFHTEVPQTQYDDQDLSSNLFDDITNFQQDGVNGNSMFIQECSMVPETPNIGAFSGLHAAFGVKPIEAAKQEARCQTLSSSSFSSVESDELAQMQKDAESASTPRLCNQILSSKMPEGSPGETKGGSSHAEKTSAASSHSSQSLERPRSQANTSSRLMPSHVSASKQLQPPPGSRVTRLKLPIHHPKLGRILEKLSDSASPDKRKCFTYQTDNNSTSKKQRGLSSAKPAFPSPSFRRRSPRSPGQSIGNQGLPKSDISHTKGNLAKPSHSRIQGRSPEFQPRHSSLIPSDRAYPSRQRPSKAPAVPAKRHSSRVTRNQSRNGTAFGDDLSDRFNEELQGLH